MRRMQAAGLPSSTQAQPLSVHCIFHPELPVTTFERTKSGAGLRNTVSFKCWSQVPTIEGTALLPFSQMDEIGDALRQRIFPHLDLQHVVALATTCRAWHDLINHTPLDQMSASVCRAVLPSGLTCKLPFLELVKRQAELLARLRGKLGSCVRIQRLSFNEHLPGAGSTYAVAQNNDSVRHVPDDSSLQRSAQSNAALDVSSMPQQTNVPGGSSIQGSLKQEQPMYVPPLRFRQLVWSPCADLEHASRWIALQGDDASKRIPLVVDIDTGQQVRFQGGPPSLVTIPYDPPFRKPATDLEPTWLSTSDSLLLHHAQQTHARPCEPSSMRIADACSQSMSPVPLPGALHMGNSHVFTACTGEGGTKDILACIAAPVMKQRLEDQIIVYDVAAWRPLYHLSCPQNVFQSFMHSQHVQRRPGVHTGPGTKAWVVAAGTVTLSPRRDMIAVVWQSWLNECDQQRAMTTPVWFSLTSGFSVHSVIGGDCKHSMPLAASDAASAVLDVDSPSSCVQWLPRSSNLMYIDGNGLHLMTAAGQLLWSSTLADRCTCSCVITEEARHWYSAKASTLLHASPCGCWILVNDAATECHNQGSYRLSTSAERITRVSLIDATTGRVVASHVILSPQHAHGIWSSSGEVCFLPGHPLVFGACQDAHAAPTFQKAELVGECGRLAARPASDINSALSLSPCGRVVIGLESDGMVFDTSITFLQLWQLPSASAPSCGAVPRVEPARCAELTILEPEIRIIAWHPLHSACVCAVSDMWGGVHLIDARAKRCVKSWSEDELHGPATPSHVDPDYWSSSGSVLAGSDEEEPDDESYAIVEHVLEWSRDGCRLAVASGESKTSGARCSVVHF